MLANGCQQLTGGDVVRRDRGDEVPRVRKMHLAVLIGDVAIDAQRDLAAREVQLLANVSGVL